MRGTEFPPVGIAYEVLEGPFTGSRFFLCHIPRGARTEVLVAGEFVSPTPEPEEIAPAIGQFFTTEFEQDRTAIEGLARIS